MSAGRSGRRAALLCALGLLGAGVEAQGVKGPATAAEAQQFVEAAEARLMKLSEESGRADWVKNTHITDDTEILAALAQERLLAANMELAKAATRFDGVKLPDDVGRRLKLLKLAITLPAPDDAAKREELTRLLAGMEGAYGKGKYCRPGKDGKEECLDLDALSRILAESRDPKELLEAWRGWHAISPPYRGQYTRFVEPGQRGRDASWASPTWAPSGGRSTTCRRTRSPRRSTGSGSRCGRSTSRCTPTCAASCARPTAPRWCPRRGRSRPTCSATCGRRSGGTSTRWWRPRRARPRST